MDQPPLPPPSRYRIGVPRNEPAYQDLAVQDAVLEFLQKEFPHLSFQIGTAMEGWAAEGEFMVVPVLSTRPKPDGYGLNDIGPFDDETERAIVTALQRFPHPNKKRLH